MEVGSDQLPVLLLYLSRFNDDLMDYLFLSTAGRKSCPLCPEEKFKACYSHKLRRHLQNLHWKVYVEFESMQIVKNM